MIPHHHDYRRRAASALHQLVGEPGKELFLPTLPVAIEIADARLIVTAGDQHKALDPFSLKPLAEATGRSVVATWVDQMLSGHKFLIDAVLMTDGKAVAYPERRWSSARAEPGSLLPKPATAPRSPSCHRASAWPEDCRSATTPGACSGSLAVRITSSGRSTAALLTRPRSPAISAAEASHLTAKDNQVEHASAQIARHLPDA